MSPFESNSKIILRRISRFISASIYYILGLTANPGQGKGGTCFGDSGSPILEEDTDTILGVCSWGTNGNCAGVSYEQRIDTPDLLTWITSFVS